MEDWIVVENQRQRANSISSQHAPDSPPRPGLSDSLIRQDYFTTRQPHTNPFADSGPHTPSAGRELQDTIQGLLAEMECRRTPACTERCVCDISNERVLACLTNIKEIISENPGLIDQLTIADRDSMSCSLAHSIILVPDEARLSAPTNLDTVFRPENLSSIGHLLTSTANRVGAAQATISSRQVRLLRALPSTQAVNVVLGLCTVYYVLPNALGLTLVRRVFDMGLLQSTVLYSSWELVRSYFAEFDESSGNRYALVSQ